MRSVATQAPEVAGYSIEERVRIPAAAGRSGVWVVCKSSVLVCNYSSVSAQWNRNYLVHLWFNVANATAEKRIWQ